MCTDSARESLVGYLYGELASDELRAFETHLKSCGACRGEVAELRGVRDDLLAWAPPECRDLPSSWADAPIVQVTPMAKLRGWMPAFGLAAAAMLILSVSAAIANLEVRYDANGFVVRTGRAPEAAARAAEPAVARLDSSAPRVTSDDLAALEQRILQSFAASNTRIGAQTVALTSDNPQLTREVRRLIEDSERRTRQEIANRFLELVTDFEGHRSADMMRVQQIVQQGQSRTNAELAQTREAVRLMLASSQSPQR